MTTAPASLFDPYLPGVSTNPYPYYARVREESPIYFIEHRGFWTLAGWEAASATVHDPRFSAATGLAQVEPIPLSKEDRPPYAHSVATEDPPTHTRLRRIISEVFGPRMFRAWEPRIQQRAASMVEELAERNGAGEADLVKHFAHPLPAQTFVDMMGLPAEDEAFLSDISSAALRLVPGMSQVGFEVTMEAAAATASMGEYCERLIAERRRSPRGDSDVVTAMINARDPETGQGMSHDELLGNLGVLILGGLDTTIGLIGNGMVALARHPDQLAHLVADPELCPMAIEEMLRWDPPVHSSYRDTTEEVQIGEVTLPAGARVQILWGAANRDPARFGPTAEDFIVNMKRPTHGTFGVGAHHCAGSALARLIAREGFRVFVNRFQGITLRGEPVLYDRAFPVLRRHTSVPALLTERAA